MQMEVRAKQTSIFTARELQALDCSRKQEAVAEVNKATCIS